MTWTWTRARCTTPEHELRARSFRHTLMLGHMHLLAQVLSPVMSSMYMCVFPWVHLSHSLLRSVLHHLLPLLPSRALRAAHWARQPDRRAKLAHLREQGEQRRLRRPHLPHRLWTQLHGLQRVRRFPGFLLLHHPVIGFGHWRRYTRQAFHRSHTEDKPITSIQKTCQSVSRLCLLCSIVQWNVWEKDMSTNQLVLVSQKTRTPEWLQEFREILVHDEIPEHGDSHASSSYEASLEPTFKRREDLGTLHLDLKGSLLCASLGLCQWILKWSDLSRLLATHSKALPKSRLPNWHSPTQVSPKGNLTRVMLHQHSDAGCHPTGVEPRLTTWGGLHQRGGEWDCACGGEHVSPTSLPCQCDLVAHVRRHFPGSGDGQLVNDTDSLLTPTPSRLHCKDHQTTPSWASQLWAGRLFVPPSLLQHCPVDVCGVWVWLSCAAQGGPKGDIHSQQTSTKAGEVLSQDLDASLVGTGDPDVHVLKECVETNPRPCLSENARHHTLDGCTSFLQAAVEGTSNSVFPMRVQRGAATAHCFCDWQGKVQPFEQQHTKQQGSHSALQRGGRVCQCNPSIATRMRPQMSSASNSSAWQYGGLPEERVGDGRSPKLPAVLPLAWFTRSVDWRSLAMAQLWPCRSLRESFPVKTHSCDTQLRQTPSHGRFQGCDVFHHICNVWISGADHGQSICPWRPVSSFGASLCGAQSQSSHTHRQTGNLLHVSVCSALNVQQNLCFSPLSFVVCHRVF